MSSELCLLGMAPLEWGRLPRTLVGSGELGLATGASKPWARVQAYLSCGRLSSTSHITMKACSSVLLPLLPAAASAARHAAASAASCCLTCGVGWRSQVMRRRDEQLGCKPELHVAIRFA